MGLTRLVDWLVSVLEHPQVADSDGVVGGVIECIIVAAWIYWMVVWTLRTHIWKFQW